MSFLLCGALIGLGVLVLCLILWFTGMKYRQEDLVLPIGIFAIITFICILAWIIQIIELKQENIRQTAEREQILYQVENLTDDKDKVKLNEWILSYNDWVNDINAEKQAYGWLAWHYTFDMSNHTIIDLV